MAVEAKVYTQNCPIHHMPYMASDICVINAYQLTPKLFFEIYDNSLINAHT